MTQSAGSKVLGLGVFMLAGAPLCLVLHFFDVEYYLLGLVRIPLQWLALASLIVGLVLTGFGLAVRQLEKRQERP